MASPLARPRAFEDRELVDLAERFGTPLYAYRAETILERLERLRRAGGGRGFDVVRYAQKANPNLALLRLLREAGAVVDAVSAGELRRALAAGFDPKDVLFCADLFDRAALEVLAEHPFPVNLGTADMLEALAALRPRSGVTLRVNPGFGHGHDPKVETGGETSKHGIWHEELPAALERARSLGLWVRGLHMHIGSGSDLENLERVCAAMETAAAHAGSTLESISAGGGLPVPYREEDPPLDLARLAAAWSAARERIEASAGHPVTLEIEPGRYLVAEAGVLLTEVRAIKRSGSLDYVLVDAGFHNLIRPAMYGAFHRITAVGRSGEPVSPMIVAGPLCESADVFTQKKGGLPDPQLLPDLAPGDLLCIHDAGAYGSSMASNYNSQPLCAEVLVQDGRARLVRRRQSFEEMIAGEIQPG